MYSATAWISRSVMRAATPRIMPFGSFARAPERNALSWVSMYSENCPEIRGYCAGIPAPDGPWQPAQAATEVAAFPPR